MNTEIIKNIYKFVRGDFDVKSFEKWVYQTKVLETIFSEDLYLDIISTNYHVPAQVYVLKKTLKKWLHQSHDLDCQCLSLANFDITDMGSEREDTVFKTLQQLNLYGDPFWWLALYQCSICTQSWLVAQECRHNDVHCFKRLTNDESYKIIKVNLWPEYFKTYEELLILGKQKGCSVTFTDPLNSCLIYTTIDLAKARPGIFVYEIASLLDLDYKLALEVCKIAISEEQVDICMVEEPPSH